MPRSSLLGFLLAITLIACGEPAEDCDFSLPQADPGTGYVDKNVFQGSWEHTTTLLDAPAASGLMLGAATEPVLVDWVLFEGRIAAHDDFGPRFSLAVIRHIDTPPHYISIGEETLPCVPPVDRPWYERTLAQVDWRTDLVAAPDALAFAPSSSAIEPLMRVHEPTFNFSEERSEIAAMSFRMSYRVTADCEGCDAATILVEHRFIRRFDLDGA